jgi:Amt family ammonium transporter
MRKYFTCLLALTLCLLPMAAMAQAPAPTMGMSKETSYILNSFLFLIGGVLVMWMTAGFAMLEAGLVRAQNTATICLKSFALFAIAAIMFYVIGYNLMYVNVSSHDGLFGSFKFFTNPTPAEVTLMTADAASVSAAAQSVVGAEHSAQMAQWFFQMVFAATAASIVSGTIAERMKLFPFLIFVALLTGVIYPLAGSWSWGQGWLSALGFKDFAGSTVVHSVGGWCALTGAIILGPRLGKYSPSGKVVPFPGANIPLATLGTLILWMGWFGFNGASVLALDSAKAVTTMGTVFVNTNLAAAAGCLAAMLYATMRFGKPDLTMVLNGALAGLVSITATPDSVTPVIAMAIGGVGGVLCAVAVTFFDKLKIDDVVGALSVHLVAGVWGTLAVAIFSNGNYVAQLTGIVAVGAFTSLVSSVVWSVMKFTIGIRVSEKVELEGTDRSEVGIEAYPDFEIIRT